MSFHAKPHELANPEGFAQTYRIGPTDKAHTEITLPATRQVSPKARASAYPPCARIGPATPIIGALITAGIASLVTYRLMHKRKAITFIVGKAESLTDGLRARGGPNLKVSVDKQEFESLNRIEVRAINTGNMAIGNCEFEILLPGEHSWAFPSMNSSNLALQTAVLIKVTTIKQYSAVKFSMPFFNPKERLEIGVFYDADPVKADVSCRLEDVRCKIRQGLNVDSFFEEVDVTSASTAMLSLARLGLKAMIRW